MKADVRSYFRQHNRHRTDCYVEGKSGPFASSISPEPQLGVYLLVAEEVEGPNKHVVRHWYLQSS